VRRIGPMLVLAACAKREAPVPAPVAEAKCLGVEIADAHFGPALATATPDGGLVTVVVSGFAKATVVALDAEGRERWRTDITSPDRAHWKPKGVFVSDAGVLVAGDDADSRLEAHDDQRALVQLDPAGVVSWRKRLPGHRWEDVVQARDGSLLAAVRTTGEPVAVVRIDGRTFEETRIGEMPDQRMTDYFVAEAADGPAAAWLDWGPDRAEYTLSVVHLGAASKSQLLAGDLRSRALDFDVGTDGRARALITTKRGDLVATPGPEPSVEPAPERLRYGRLAGDWLVTWAPDGEGWSLSTEPPWGGQPGELGLKHGDRELPVLHAVAGRVALAPTGDETWLVFSAYDAAGQLRTRAIRTHGAADLQPCAQLDEATTG
jgi:hypothetical protein